MGQTRICIGKVAVVGGQLGETSPSEATEFHWLDWFTKPQTPATSWFRTDLGGKLPEGVSSRKQISAAPSPTSSGEKAEKEAHEPFPLKK